MTPRVYCSCLQLAAPTGRSPFATLPLDPFPGRGGGREGLSGAGDGYSKILWSALWAGALRIQRLGGGFQRMARAYRRGSETPKPPPNHSVRLTWSRIHRVSTAPAGAAAHCIVQSTSPMVVPVVPGSNRAQRVPLSFQMTLPNVTLPGSGLLHRALVNIRLPGNLLFGGGGGLGAPFRNPPPPTEGGLQGPALFFPCFSCMIHDKTTGTVSHSCQCHCHCTVTVSLQGGRGLLQSSFAVLIHPCPPPRPPRPPTPHAHKQVGAKFSDDCIEETILWPLQPLFTTPSRVKFSPALDSRPHPGHGTAGGRPGAPNSDHSNCGSVVGSGLK